MYFVGLPEQEKMVYATRVEALRRRFGQETDTSIALVPVPNGGSANVLGRITGAREDGVRYQS